MTDIEKRIEEGKAKVREIRKIIEETKAIVEDYPRVHLDNLKAWYPTVFAEAQYVGVGVGWYQIIVQTVEGVLKIWPQVEINEIREKMAALRIHLGLVPPESIKVDVYKMIAKAQMRSIYTCEVCGDDGRIRIPKEPHFFWHACRCDRHTQPGLQDAPLSREYDDLHVWIVGKRYAYDPETHEILES
jgi:hypothetical protein